MAQDEEPATQSEEGDEAADRTVRRLGDVESEDYPINLAIPAAAPAGSGDPSEFGLPDPDQDARLEQLLATLTSRPGNQAALEEMDTLLTEVLLTANELLDQGHVEDAAPLLKVIRSVNPRKAGLDDAEGRLAGMKQISAWLEQAEVAMQTDRLVEPPEDNALHFYSGVLALDPANRDALDGLRTVQQGLVRWALEDARNLDFESAESLLQQAEEVRPQQSLVQEARAKIAGFRGQQAVDIELAVIRAIQANDFDLAEFTLIDLIALGGHEETVAELRERINQERLYGRYVPGQVIQDQLAESGGTAPAVVVIPPGGFLMGSGPRDRSREDDEEPQHRVTFARSFGLAMQEVTVGQFRQFIEATGYQTESETRGSSRVWDESLGRLLQRERVNWRHDYQGNPAGEDLPVLHVSWNDAQAYARWLSEETGATYRLPSEAEWEHAIRAGSTTQYWWGDNRPREVYENLTGAGDQSASGRNWGSSFRGYADGHWGPAPGASFKANSNGLFDMAGNVSEWVQDCWHPSYVRAPEDGSAWENPGCNRRVVRGGYWASAPEQARSAARLAAPPELHGPQVGFRVARDL